MKSFVRFEDAGTSPSGRTRIWRVMSVSQASELGRIFWYGPWRQYVFEPADGTLWSDGCLLDVQAFVSSAIREHKLKAHSSAKVDPAVV